MKMNNRDRTKENTNIIKKLYLNTKPAIISSVKKIVTTASQELAMEEVEQVHSTEKSLAFREDIIEQIVQEFNFFIETRAKGNYIYSVDNDSDFISSKFNKDYEIEKQYLEELDKLLDTAEKIERKKTSLAKTENTILFGSLLLLFSSVVILQSIDIYNANDFLINIIAFAFLASLIFALHGYTTTRKEYNKEKRALNKIVVIIQEVIPYHLKDMTVLAKANFEVTFKKI